MAHVRGLLAAMFSVLLLGSTTPSAAAMDSPVCQSARYRAVAKHTRTFLDCRVEASGPVVIQDCKSAATADFATALLAIDEHRGCDLAPDEAEMGGQVYAFDVALAGLVGYPELGSGCVLGLWKAASRYARLALLTHARNARSPSVARLPRRMARLASSLSVAFGRAERRGDCGAPPPAVAAVAEAVAVLIENVRPICGNDRRAFCEECDGSDSPTCPGLCGTDCTCGTSVCGDGQVTGDEECDGDADDLCPGLCQSNCRCPDVFCGNDVVEAGEECDGTDVAACAAAMAYAQCGAPGEMDACTCSSIPVELDACSGPPATGCPAGQSCVTLGLLLPTPTLVHGCIAPEPDTCTGADQCTLSGSICADGSCCGTIGTACSTANPCCASDQLRCGSSLGGIATCCLDSLTPCVRNEDCCNFTCTTDGSGARYCAFF